MLRPDPDVLEGLGLARDATLTELESLEGPASAVGHGFLAAEALPLEPLARGVVGAVPAWTDLDLPHLARRLPGARIAYWDPQPAVLLIQVADGEIIHGGEATALDDGLVALDSRQGKAFVRIRGSRGEVVLAARHGDVTVFAVEPPLSPELDALSRLQPEPQISIEAPPIDALLAGRTAPGWMAAAYAQLAGAASAFASVAAVGLVGRLWSPPATLSSGERRKQLEASAAGDGPLDRARAWYGSLPAAARQQSATIAIARADRLRDRLGSLSDRIAADPAAARGEALAFLAARDDLESVAALARPMRELEEALAALDRDASTHHTIWSALDAWETEPRLAAVAWQEPSAWWGLLAHAD